MTSWWLFEPTPLNNISAGQIGIISFPFFRAKIPKKNICESPAPIDDRYIFFLFLTWFSSVRFSVGSNLPFPQPERGM